uniref:Uncharacterized protein n=1 Tax=Triticum urartu TaxID=4572 RepID=A0A8R7QKN2_TRIUA
MVGSSGWKLALVAARITSSSNQPAEMKLRTFSQPGNRKEYGCARRRFVLITSVYLIYFISAKYVAHACRMDEKILQNIKFSF